MKRFLICHQMPAYSLYTCMHPLPMRRATYLKPTTLTHTTRKCSGSKEASIKPYRNAIYHSDLIDTPSAGKLLSATLGRACISSTEDHIALALTSPGHAATASLDTKQHIAVSVPSSRGRHNLPLPASTQPLHEQDHHLLARRPEQDP
jgi:hypothetical protein